MAHSEEYRTVIKLNSDQAEKEIDKLQKKVDDLRKKQSGYASDSGKFKSLQKEIDKNNAKIDTMRNRLKSVNEALRNMSDAKPKQLKETIRDINVLLNSGDIKRGSEEWRQLTSAMKEANTELAKIKNESKASQSVLSKFFKFLNDSWGGIFVLMQSISGVSTTIRKAVQDYAQIEEEMADVRKYTGLSDDAVRDLNEDLKKVDTRTSREELNQLAGAAGRLGKDSKKDILEFVEAGNMIKVALGDDLGDGAIDKVGKLAMAFGEDEKKGLRGAMLSTGSALNELAQNSSAQAGYIVDYTARVAGFGKQLGLTQAQIMGYGAVMDENMLRDEMAATAFGNMLTKMQTDTHKFAKIAGMDMKSFSDLLTKDANGAILALAESLKKADPQTMMKMLDDMGLDGSRAVGVLSTLADKIDDVKARQELATKAYAEGTSVQKEYNTMNNTVQAEIEKAKKRFHELSIELGERLLPVVKYTITGASMLAKTLSVLTGFVYAHWKSIAILTAYVTALTVAWKFKTIAIKAGNVAETISIALKKGHAVVVNVLKQAYIAWRIVIAAVTANQVRLNSAMVDMKRLQMTNVWTALITVVLTAAVAIYGAVKAWKKHNEAVRNSLQEVKNLRAQQQLEKDMNKQVNESIAEQKTKVEQLTRIIHSNAYSVNERKNAIKQLQSIIPDYHASISKEGKLYNDNKNAIKEYIQKLEDAALAEAIYAKKVEINKKKLDLGYKENRIKGSLKAVQAYRDTQQQTKEEEWVDQDGRVHKATLKTKSAIESDRQQKIHEERLANVHSEQKVVEAEEAYIDKVLSKNKKLNELYVKKVTGSTTTQTTVTPTSDNTTYKPDDKGHAADEEKKRLKEAEQAAKAESDAMIAAKTHEYAMGKIAYRQYIQDMAKLQIEGLQKRRDVYEKGSAEYEKLNRQIEELSFKGDQQVNQLKLEDLRRCMLKQQAEIEAQAAREEITENQKNERLRLLQETYLADKVELYKVGSKERIDAEWELEETERKNKMEREKQYLQQLNEVRQQWLGMSNEKQLQIALEGLDNLHQKGLLKEEEYQRALIAIQAQYAKTPSASEQTRETGSNMLKNAENRAEKYSSLSGYDSSSLPILSTIQNYKAVMENLDLLYKDDEANHEAYLEAKRQATSQFCQDIGSQMQAAYDSINNIMSAAGNYFQAEADAEVAATEKKYDKLIAAAGKNEKKKQKLEQERDKKIAKIKSAANKKAVTIQIAQAVAQTAMNAISAYGAAMQTGPAGLVLAPIAAGMAVAAGMLQIATIKKQAEAQEQGYFSGGFTGGNRYKKEAGVVHEGEFVANHQAVNNPNVLPMLQFLDRAQRNNTIGSLTAQDVSRQLGGGNTTMVAPVVNVQNDNSELSESLNSVQETNEKLNRTIEKGIHLNFDEFHKEYEHYKKIISR